MHDTDRARCIYRQRLRQQMHDTDKGQGSRCMIQTKAKAADA